MSRRLLGLVLCAAALACRTAIERADRSRELAIAEAMVGDPVAALRQLRGVVARDPSDSLAFAYLADLYRRNGWSKEGFAFFAEQVRLARARAPELRYYASAFAAYTGRIAEAERWAAEARTRREPTEAEALVIAEGLAAAGRRTAAIDLLAGAVRANPDRAEPAVRLAALYAAAGDTAAARREIDAALTRLPDDPRVVGAAAMLELGAGRLPESERLTHRWLALAPTSPEARWNLARIALRRGDAAADSLLKLTTATGK